MAFTSPERLSLRPPLLIFILQMVAIDLTECVRVHRTLCFEPCSSRLLRAAQLSITARGTTFLGIVFALVYPAYIALAEGKRAYRQEGTPGLRKLFGERYAKTLEISAGIWAALVIYNFIFIGSPIFSTPQVADFSKGIMVDLEAVTFASKQEIVGNGFWVDPKGYVVTCARKRDSPLRVGTMLPSVWDVSDTESIYSLSGVKYTWGQSAFYDSDTGVEIIRVFENPFIRTSHTGVRQGLGSEITEAYWTACISDTRPEVGEPIFLAASEPGTQGSDPNDGKSPPEIMLTEGRITRLGNEMSGPGHWSSLRIYTTLPLKRWYRGAPVLDASRKVIGVVADSPEGDTGDAVLVPAKYIIDALRAASPSMTVINPQDRGGPAPGLKKQEIDIHSHGGN
jgi:hypothetical protein